MRPLWQPPVGTASGSRRGKTKKGVVPLGFIQHWARLVEEERRELLGDSREVRIITTVRITRDRLLNPETERRVERDD
jgi:hypothetical protein